MAMVEKDDPVCYPTRKVHFMGSNQHGRAIPRQLLHHLQYLANQLWIECRGGLIEEKCQWLHCESARGRYALLLAAGQLIGKG